MIANPGGFTFVCKQEGQILPTYDFLVSAGSLDHRPCPFKLFCLISDIQVTCIIKSTRRFYYMLEKGNRGSIQSLSLKVELGACFLSFTSSFIK